MSTGSSSRAILYAFIANLGIALAKLAAALYTKSGSMLAESIHSFADSGNQVLLYVGLRQSQRPPDAKHPLGYGKTSYFWSFIVALMLFSMGGLFSIYEGWHKLHVTEPLNKPWIALLVLGGVDSARVRLAGRLRARDQQAARRQAISASGWPARAMPSWSWCWARTSPRWWAWCWHWASWRWRR